MLGYGYVPGQICFKVNLDLTQVDSQFVFQCQQTQEIEDQPRLNQNKPEIKFDQ